MKTLIRRLVPKRILSALLPMYHFSFALLSALFFRFPSRHIMVVGVTGTKGKSSTAEFLNAVLEAAGYKTALASTIRFKIGSESRPNLFKMTMPGRFFLQQFLREAVTHKADAAIIEMTSEGVKQFRHTFIELDALVFTNIAPEHIESHGSFERYVAAKLQLARALKRSQKNHKVMVANMDDPHGIAFLETAAVLRAPYSSKDMSFRPTKDGGVMSYKGEDIHLKLPGAFNAMNARAAIAFGEHCGIPLHTIKKGLELLRNIPGRVERIDADAPFEIIVDYAHTPDSIDQVCKAFEGKNITCVFGATGGGRDKWKRPEMGRIAETHCNSIILTNDDPYEEDPQEIVEDIARGMNKRPTIIIDRRAAIREALRRAGTSPQNIVLILGKGTDPFLMEAGGKKTPWSDAQIAREEYEALNKRRG